MIFGFFKKPKSAVPLNYERSGQIMQAAKVELDRLGYGAHSEIWQHCNGCGARTPIVRTLWGRHFDDHHEFYIDLDDGDLYPDLHGHVFWMVDEQNRPHTKVRIAIREAGPATW